MKKNVLQTALLVSILALGAFFRFYNLNWDQNQHLHPDERFLTMVGNAMRVPTSFTQYLTPTISTFNPANIGFSFFVYGIFPVTLNKLLAIGISNDTYTAFTLQGRFLSALADSLIIIFVFLTGLLFEKKHILSPTIKYCASFFYATFVLPIQLAHYFAVDTFLSFFMFASFYFALRFAFEKSIFNVMLSALCFGLALSCKVTAIFIAPLPLFLLLRLPLFNREAAKSFFEKKHLLTFTAACLLFAMLSYFTLRLADPYLFEHINFFDPTINKTFFANLQSLKSFEGKDVSFPPAIQWISKPPIIFSLGNLALLGIGIPAFFFLLIGMFVIVKRYRQTLLFVILLWMLCFFLYQSTQFVKAMRYFIFIYPFLSLIAAVGFVEVTKKIHAGIKIFLLLLILLPPLMFLSIYVKPVTRITASLWMYHHLPNNSFVLFEHWDDPLPLLLSDNQGKSFPGEALPVFDQDTPEKWKKMDNLLAKADYYVLSSNRGWGSMPTVPKKYPLMTKFYQDLFAGKTNYQKVAEFSSYPSLAYLGIPLTFPDDWADESFTVYDHPKVLIFKNIEH